MGMSVLRAIAALAVALSSFGAWEARAQSSDPNCDSGMPDGFKVLEQHSSTEIPPGNPTSFVCNLDGKYAGLAVTIEYACAKETEAAWQSKVGNRKKNVVSRSSTEVLVRENHEVKGYTGEYAASEKLFIRVDARTIATVYVMSDPTDGENSKLRFGAEDAASYARGRATANAPFSSNWKCPEGNDMPPLPTATTTGEPQPPTTGTGKPKEREVASAPFLGLSWPVIIVMVTVVVITGAGFTWVVRRPRRIRVQPR